MVDLMKKPFFLSPEKIEWVENTRNTMTLDEKIGQLFILMKAIPGVDENRIERELKDYHQGGLRWQGGDLETVYLQNTTYQKHSKIPLLIAANCDEGGNGCLPKEGTFIATAAQAAAHESTDTAYHMGLVSAREASAIGCNWLFNPIADIYLNWRNTIVNTRCFGDETDTVLRNTRAYIQGVKDANPNMACCAKHFPGDGMEELDQHLVLGMNELEEAQWQASYGKVYRGLIEDGIETIMVGHIALPKVSKKYRPAMSDREIMPATLAPELLQDLLREELGFNGLVLTDATHMIGFSAMKKRSEALPLAIEAGCDMILFANDTAEDIQFMKEAIDSGILSMERVDEAVTRILGLKAKLNLTVEEVAIPDPNRKAQWIQSEEHLRFRIEAAERSVVLVKDSQRILPLKPTEKKRIWLVYVQSAPNSSVYTPDPARAIVKEELEAAGFEVTLAPNFYDLELENGPTPMNMARMMTRGSRKEFANRYDLVLVVLNIKGYAQENNTRIKWSAHHSVELPWYISEVPTVGVSLNLTNHLIDLPQIATFIQAFGSTRENIKVTIDKMCGKSKFTGSVREHYFCDRWETRL